MLTQRLLRLSVPGLLAFFIGVADPARPALAAEGLTRFDRDQGRMMLGIVRKDLTEYYYDPEYHGLRLNEVFTRAEEAIARATSHAEIFSAIAGTLRALDDSHTYFVPPSWSATIEFGWFVQMFGERCHIVAVKPGSAAESLGLKKGDLVQSIDGRRPSREDMSDMMYDQRVLTPRASCLLVVQPPGGESREVIVRTKVTQEKRVFTRSDRDAAFRELEDLAYLDRHRLHEVGESLLIWRMPGFYLRREDVGRRLSRAAKFPNMILDLRGNPGGAIETLEYMLGGFIGDKVPIGEVKSREKIPPIVSRKPPGRYEGTLVVLVDSESGSSAEIFARAMQINGRAKVLGDRTAGSVMMSLFHPQKIGMGMTLYFGSSITVADIVMTDGKSLERLGVTPDEVLIPTGEDLAAGRDPVLSRAASLCGVSLSPSEAGALFPLEWKR